MKHLLLAPLIVIFSTPIFANDLPEYTYEEKQELKKRCLLDFERVFNDPIGARGLRNSGVEDMNKAKEFCECQSRATSINKDPKDAISDCSMKLGITMPSRQQRDDLIRSKKGKEIIEMKTNQCIKKFQSGLPDYSNSAPKYCRCVSIVALQGTGREGVMKNCRKFLKRNY